MYYQLGRITGRLMATSHLQAPLFPVAPIALQRAEPPTIQYSAAALSTVPEACPAPGAKRLMPGTNIPYPPVPENIRKSQQQFQTDDDVPVFLKGGPFDAVLYRFTMALCIAGLIGVGHTIYTHAVPAKNN